MRRVAVVYEYFPHYREPIVDELMAQDVHGIEYALVSDKDTGRHLPLRVVDPARAAKPVSEGGLRWEFVRNRWLTDVILWQSGLMPVTLSGSFDTVVYHGAPNHLSTWATVPLCRARRKRVLFWTIGGLKRESLPLAIARKRFLRMAHGLLLYGHVARTRLAAMGFPEESLYVVFNSMNHSLQVAVRERITPEVIDETRGQLFASPEWPILLWTGRLVPRRLLDQHLRLIHRLGQEGRPANLLVVGDGPVRPELEQLAQELGVQDRVRFFGSCYDENVLGPLLASADLLVAPGGTGLSCIHAAAYGTPCVTHDDLLEQGPEAEAILPGETGLLFRRGDFDDLAARVIEWLDQADRDEVRASCFHRVDTYYTPARQAKVINAAVRGEPATFSAQEQSDFGHAIAWARERGG